MDSVYIKLRERLDSYSFGFPSTESGIEIQILKKLFSQEHAEFFLKLTQKLEEPSSVAARLGITPEDAEKILEEMNAKGLIFRQITGNVRKYATIAFMHGIAEFQVNKLDKEISDMVCRYFEEAMHDSFAKTADTFLRVIPVQKYIDVQHHIASYNDAAGILDMMDNIVVTDCFCRKHRNMIDKGCDRPVETCFMFGSMGQYYLDNNMGRKVTKDEALKIIADAQRAGLVTQPGTSQNPSGMCNCCGDCCGVLSAIKRYPNPAEMVHSNHYSTIVEENCTGCGACIDICQVEAITLNQSGIAEVNPKRCIGCGLCLIACELDAVILHEKSPDRRMEVPVNTKEQFLLMAKRRGLA